jgi:hypothetical protein
MAQTKTKIRDLFNAFSNPSGGMGTMAKTTPSQIFNGRSISVPPPGPQSRMDAPSPFNGGAGAGMPATPARSGSAAPVGPSGATGQAPADQTPTAPKQWMKADGSYKSPDEIAADIAASLKASSSGPDIGRLAGAQFNGKEMTTEQLATQARLLSAARNDIAVGEKDPYGVASNSGIAYTPEQLVAIERAYAGIYDPALAGAMSKLEASQKADSDAAKWKQELEKMAVQHGYDMEKMEKDHNFQYGLAAYKAALDAKANGGAGLSDYVQERQTRVVDSATALKQAAEANPGIFGRSAALPLPDFVRSDAYRNFKADLDEAKAGIFQKEISEMRADSKTGGALGQVAVQEMTRMENSLGALNMEQSPEKMVENLQQIIDAVNRYRAVKGYPALSGASATGFITTAPDGTQVEIVGE